MLIQLLLGTLLLSGAEGTHSAPRPFDKTPGWRLLRWDQSDAEVRQALKSMRLDFTEDEADGMFPAPGPPPAPAGSQDPKPAEFVSAVFTRMRFPLDGGQGEAELLGWRLRRVSIRSAPLSTAAQVEAHMQRLRRQLGEPNEARAPSNEPGAVRLLWFNQQSRLTVTTSRVESRWVVHETYERLPTTWP